MPPPLICLVSASHLSSNPRLVKEADALHEAGYRVHVVAGRNHPPNDSFDTAILCEARWPSTIVNYATGPRSRVQRLARQLARAWVRRGEVPPLPIAIRAQHPAALHIAAVAARLPARMFLGHTLTGLAAAGRAAEARAALLGFDAEDFHPLETDAASSDLAEARSIRRIESAYLPRCAHLTAAAPLIGEAYAQTYGVRAPATVLNVFPLREAPPAPAAAALPDELRPARLYWVSQTIGPGRGLEPLFPVLGRMRVPVTLTLRGEGSLAYIKELRRQAAEAGFRGRLDVVPAAPAATMARHAAEHDLGLVLEPRTPGNRELCLANKFFTYLLAGVPVGYTPTRSQDLLGAELGPAAIRIDPGDPAGSAGRLDAFFRDLPRLGAARAQAWELARTRYNWDLEKQRLLSALAAVLPPVESPPCVS